MMPNASLAKKPNDRRRAPLIRARGHLAMHAERPDYEAFLTLASRLLEMMVHETPRTYVKTQCIVLGVFPPNMPMRRVEILTDPRNFPCHGMAQDGMRLMHIHRAELMAYDPDQKKIGREKWGEMFRLHGTDIAWLLQFENELPPRRMMHYHHGLLSFACMRHAALWMARDPDDAVDRHNWVAQYYPEYIENLQHNLRMGG